MAKLALVSQRYFCPACKQSFTETFDTLYYRRQITSEEIRMVLQAQAWHGWASIRTSSLKRWLSVPKAKLLVLNGIPMVGEAMNGSLTDIDHYIGKALTQRNERTNGILRQQTGRWHRRQNKFGKVWAHGGYSTFGHQLLQLNLAAFPAKNNSTAGWIDEHSLVLGRFSYLSHSSLEHDRFRFRLAWIKRWNKSLKASYSKLLMIFGNV